jgi:hypothetical protein
MTEDGEEKEGIGGGSEEKNKHGSPARTRSRSPTKMVPPVTIVSPPSP